MSEPIMPDQETATLALMMDREIDKRVMVALSRALSNNSDWEVRELEDVYTRNDPAAIQRVVRNILITAIMSDGSLMHQIRSKIGESLQRSPY
jgi:hypothetical protein